MQRAAEIAIDPVHPGFSGAFPAPAEIDRIYREIYLDIQERFLAAVPGYAALVS